MRALRGLVCVGLLWKVSQVCCVTEEIGIDSFSPLGDGAVHVSFVAVFREATFADLPRDVPSFARVFKMELALATEVSELAIEITMATSPPLSLKGRSVFRQGESRRVNLSHTEEAFKFSVDLERLSVLNAIQTGLEDRKHPNLGPVSIIDISPPTVEQDVKVVVPKTPATHGNSKEAFFEEHPEVLTTAIVLVVLLTGVLVALCWWILRERPEDIDAKRMTTIKVDKIVGATQNTAGGKSSDGGKTVKTKKAPLSDVKKLSQLASKNKVEFETLEFIEKIGKGSFKTVFRGRWGSNSVAIVRMRKGGVLVEARLMQKLSSHPNLVTFYRWTRDREGNEYIVMELLPLGSLDVVMRRSGDKMRNKAKVAMCAQICQAMCQLAEEKVLHRDLAARNVLVQSLDPVTVKVSDFGLAKYVSPGISSSSNILQHLPVRWIPPEVMRKQEWSEKSDVWAFGVTMWEIFSNSREPYAAEWPSDEDVVRHVIDGRRLAKPENCPEAMYHMMLECWHAKPCDRPDFKELARRFKAPMVVGTTLLEPLENRDLGDVSTRTSSSVDFGAPTKGPSAAQGSSSGGRSLSRTRSSTPRRCQLPSSPQSVTGRVNEHSPHPLSRTGSRLSEKSNRHLERREARISRRIDKSKISGGVMCESISSIPDPEFHAESDLEESTRDTLTSPNPVTETSGAVSGDVSELGSRGLIPVEIESPSDLDVRPNASAGGKMNSDVEGGGTGKGNWVGKKAGGESSPYADIGDLV
ncbi:hypothetical protein BSKO_04938 [Bryopsis sp. KO-2023]|nr:hypothetical protein BSKO_04938 [Bryopsis sp. KO-2023]